MLIIKLYGKLIVTSVVSTQSLSTLIRVMKLMYGLAYAYENQISAFISL